MAMRLSILGCGMLGGSLALACKQADPEIHITGYDALPAHAQLLLERGALDVIAADPAQAVAQAELVVLASPLSTYAPLIAQIAPHLPPGTIVSDVGSVKTPLSALADRLPQAQVVPAHPIAGAEVSGPQAADASLFRGALLILTPLTPSNTEALQQIETLWRSLGADVIALPAALHDQIYAYVSHLPHYIAFAAAGYLASLGQHLPPQDALRRVLRIARSNPVMWRDVAMANRELLLPALAAYLAVLQHFIGELHQDPAPAAAAQDTPGMPEASALAYLPRIMAASLISTVALMERQAQLDARPFAGAGMRDLIAPATTAPQADMEAISEVAAALAHHLEGFAQRLSVFEQGLGADDVHAVEAWITQARADADQLFTLTPAA